MPNTAAALVPVRHIAVRGFHPTVSEPDDDSLGASPTEDAWLGEIARAPARTPPFQLPAGRVVDGKYGSSRIGAGGWGSSSARATPSRAARVRSSR